MKWKISNLANTSQTLISTYSCLKNYNYNCEDIKDSAGYIKYIEESIELDDTIDEGKQLRCLQEELNNSSCGTHFYKRLLLDFINHNIIIVDTNISNNKEEYNKKEKYSNTWLRYNNSNI